MQIDHPRVVLSTASAGLAEADRLKLQKVFFCTAGVRYHYEDAFLVSFSFFFPIIGRRPIAHWI